MTTENGGDNDAERNRTSGRTDVVEIDGVIEHDQPSRGYHVEILLIAFASLLLEVAYTRVISFKLFYYYTYLVIGLALLGIGSGGVIMAVSGRLKRAGTDTIVMFGSLFGAISVALGYLVVARLGIASLRIWEYGTRASFSSLGRLLVICLTLFLSFVAVGVMFAALFGRRSEGIGKLYFADLLGAGLACLAAVFLISGIGPPRMIILGGVILAAVAVWVGLQRGSKLVWVSGAVTVVLAIGVVSSTILPDVRVDDAKLDPSGALDTRWSPIFRVDVVDSPTPADRIVPRKLLVHDGTLGSIIQEWDGRQESLGDFKFDEDPRSFPFDTLGKPADNVMIIGAAGGHEILASLYYDAAHTDAIELNPATYKLLTEDYADYTGHVASKPGVNYVNGDGRTYLANQDKLYDLIWYPAPDSYSATNASTAGAFVLSESYLYTTGAIKDSLEHLAPDGIVAAQFGEINFTDKPNRTLRYVNTARQALEEMGIEDPASHVLVSTSSGSLSTVLVKKTPFTDEEIERFTSSGTQVADTELRYTPNDARDPRIAGVLAPTEAEREAALDAYPYNVSAIDDNGPFFWHFAPFDKVVREYRNSIDGANPDREDATGERVLVLLLVIATVMAAVFLLLPFVAMRRVWTKLPRKGTSALYFAALGLGFMFFEITLIQRLTLFLGFPTYSLTVTLASLLIFTGVGALLSARVKHDTTRAAQVLAPVIVVLGAAYLFLLPPLTDALQSAPLGVKFLVTFVVLAPLGICLGMFMPLGIGAVSELTDHGAEYVAWGWAVNGFASVVGAVLTTLLAMSFGFNTVLVVGLVVYLAALGVLHGLLRVSSPNPVG